MCMGLALYFAVALEAGYGRSSARKLRLDGRLVDYGPYLHNLLRPKRIKDVLCKGHPLSVDLQAEEIPGRPAVEPQPARDMRRLGDQELNVEMEVGNLAEVSLQHGAIACDPDPLIVVDHVLVDERVQTSPVLPVQTGDVISIDIGQVSFRHDDCPCRLGRLARARERWCSYKSTTTYSLSTSTLIVSAT